MKPLVNSKALLNDYYYMAYSQLQYGILAWGNANKTNLSPLSKVHNRIIKMIREKETFQPNLLNIQQINKLEIEKFMFRCNANELPMSFIKYFISIESIHSYPYVESIHRINT